MQLQLFLTLVCLPILIAWGLPISLLSPLGNLVFSPFITVFLFLSSLIFFFEIGHLPNEWLIYCLERVTQLWLYLVNSADNSWLVGLIKPAWPLLIAIPFSAFIVLQYKKTASLRISTLCFALLLCSIFFYLKVISTPKNYVEQIPCNRGNVTLIKQDKQIVVIDPGYMGQRINAQSWAEYTLLPSITKAIGARTIDHCIILQPGKLTFDALHVLCSKIQINNLYLITWQGTISPSAWKSFFMLKEIAANNNVRIVRIGLKKQTLLCGTNKIIISPLQEKLTYHEAQYPALQVESYIDNESITIYSAKYKIKTRPKNSLTTDQTEALNGAA